MGFAARPRLELARAQYCTVPEMLIDLATNRTQIEAIRLAIALPRARAGRMKLLAGTTITRSPAPPVEAARAVVDEEAFAERLRTEGQLPFRAAKPILPTVVPHDAGFLSLTSDSLVHVEASPFCAKLIKKADRWATSLKR